MAQKTYRPVKVVRDDYVGQEERLPTHLPIAVYYRQSTERQIGNQSTFMQQEDLPEMLVARGWKPEQIILIDDDAGISGTKSFNERKGASKLMKMIARKEIGAVCVIDVSRLTRDEWGIDANVFIKACAASEVITVTPTWNFVFHGRSASFHIRQFRHQAEYAAEHITYHMRERLIPAKRRKQKQGKYVGHRVPLGYCVDQHGNYLVFEPYADYIRMYFQLLLEHRGNVMATVRHIHDSGLYLPRYDAPDVVRELPPGCKLVIQEQNSEGTKRRLMNWTERGYLPTRDTLTRMATNVVYLGWWTVKDEIISKSNHPAIVESALFWDVFNMVSPNAVTGEANSSYNPHPTRWKNKHGEERGERPLLGGMLYHICEDGSRIRVHTQWEHQQKWFAYEAGLDASPTKGRSKSKSIWRKRVDFIEEPILAMLRERIDRTKAEDILDADAAYRERRNDQLSLLKARLKELNAGIQTATENLAYITERSLIPSVQNVILSLQEQRSSVEAQIAELEADTSVVNELVNLKKQIDHFADHWEQLSYAQRLKAVTLCIDHVTTQKQGNDLRVEVIWSDMYFHEGTTFVDASVLIVAGSRGDKGWLDSEVATLRALVERRSTRAEIQAAFPTRTWKAIKKKWYYLMGSTFQENRDDADRDENSTNELTCSP